MSGRRISCTRVAMVSSLRSRGGGSGRRVFINEIRGIIDGVSCGAGVCLALREGGKCTFVDVRQARPSDTFNQPDWSSSYFDSHRIRRSHLLSLSPPHGITIVRVTRFARLLEGSTTGWICFVYRDESSNEWNYDNLEFWIHVTSPLEWSYIKKMFLCKNMSVDTRR